MLFNSVAFLIFLPLVYAAYRLLPHRAQNLLLLASSYLFYGWWDLRFLFLIVLSTTVDYICGLLISEGSCLRGQRARAFAWLVASAFVFVTVDWGGVLTAETFSWRSLIGAVDTLGLVTLLVCIAVVPLVDVALTRIQELPAERRRKLALTASVVVNLGILGVFKYFNFFVENLEQAIATVGGDPERFRLDIVLPVGISFYTFQTMSYTIDIYRGKLRATPGFLDFALFVSFFPQLVAGPIERAVNFLPQVLSPRRVSVDATLRGLHLIIYGLFKKVAIADGLARTVDAVYSSSGAVSWADVTVGTLAFAIQIYCDFSGYSDIARGVAKLFGFDLMVNFRQPYFSRNPQDFWTRWHISLSSWLRDYLYIPLGGNRHGVHKTYRNLMATMLLGGLWHGAAWNFVLWGTYQGALLCLHKAWSTFRLSAALPRLRVPGFVTVGCFFVVTCYGWLLFRAPSLEAISALTSVLVLDFGNLDLGAPMPTAAALASLPLLGVIELVEFFGTGAFYRALPMPLWTGLYAGLFIGLLMSATNEGVQFIYFAF